MLYYVDCFDHTYWIQADRRHKALAIAESLCGHDEINECLDWDETLWGSNISSMGMNAAIAVLESLGETVYTA